VTAARADGPRPDPVEVVLTGELDIATIDDAERRIEAAEAGSPPVLVVDLSQLEFVDSSGVRLVLLADDRARGAGRRLAVRLGTGQALRVFQALGLMDKVDVVPVDGV
jgi:anti-anti-sigma factor